MKSFLPSSGGVAQLAEQRTHKPRVGRSIRPTATKSNFIRAADSLLHYHDHGRRIDTFVISPTTIKHGHLTFIRNSPGSQSIRVVQ